MNASSMSVTTNVETGPTAAPAVLAARPHMLGIAIKDDRRHQASHLNDDETGRQSHQL